jgi:hypothetical protein
VEWNADVTVEQMATNILSRRVDPRTLLRAGRDSPDLTDDRPYNEYFFLRRNGMLN